MLNSRAFCDAENQLSRGHEYVVHAEDALILMYRDLPRHGDEAGCSSLVGRMYVYKYVSQCRDRARRPPHRSIVQARSSLPEVDAGKLGLPASCTPAPQGGFRRGVPAAEMVKLCQAVSYLPFLNQVPASLLKIEGILLVEKRSDMSLHSLDSLVTCGKPTKRFPSRLCTATASNNLQRNISIP